MATPFDSSEPKPQQPQTGASPLVQKFRAKYPQAANMSDDEIETQVLAKYPQYAVLASPKAKMAIAAERGTEGAMAGAKARSAAPDPMSPAGFYGGRGPDGELVTEDLANTQAAVGGGLALAAAPMMAPARVGGAIFGGQEGYKRAGVTGMLGGAAMGAAAPGATMAGSVVASAADAIGGGGGMAGLSTLASALLLKKYGGSLGKLLQGRFGAQILEEGMQAAKAAAGTEKAAAAVKGVNPEMLANIEKVFLETGSSPAAAKAIAASEAARGASGAAETVSQSLPGVIRAAPNPQAMIKSGIRFTPEQNAAAIRAAQERAMLPGRSVGAKAVELPAKVSELSQEQIKQVFQLQAMAKQGGNSRKAVLAAAKELFPDNPEVVEMITGPITTMRTINVP